MRSATLLLAVVVIPWLWGEPASAQVAAAVSNTSSRPFVIGIIPVVGRNGQVGGVSIDARGVLQRAKAEGGAELQRAREQAARPSEPALQRASRLRCVSLTRMEKAIAAAILQQRPLSDELQNLAGLQRVQYVFVYPEQQEIVLAGPADAWTVAEDGAVVGRTSRRPVLQLDDFLVALRAARADDTIACSIDPHPEGLVRLQRLTSSRRFRPSASLKRMEEQLGPQRITLHGVPQSSRFARILVAADFMMKRLAMGLEEAPIDRFPSYLELLRQSDSVPTTLTPRWWLAADHSPAHDESGQAWELRGSVVRALTEEGRLLVDGTIVEEGGRSHPAAAAWAEQMTARYEELSGKLPVFAELQNCMDLAIAAAIVAATDMPGQAENDLPLLYLPELQPAPYHVPKQVASQASLVRRGRDSIVSVSGGVSLRPWSHLAKPQTDPALAKVKTRAAPRGEAWWWDAE